MRKIIFVVGLSCLLILAACGKEPARNTHSETEEIQKDIAKEEKSKALTNEQKELLVFENEITVETDIASENGSKSEFIQVKASLTNKNKETLPLTFKNDNAFSIIIFDSEGNMVTEALLHENERTQIDTQEVMRWNHAFELDNGTYKVVVELHPLDEFGSEIPGFEDEVSVELKQTK